MKVLADKLESLRRAQSEEWRIEREPHNHPDGTSHFTHVRYTSTRYSEPVTVEVANHVTPELAEMLCLLHNNLPTIIDALRETDSAPFSELKRLRAGLEIIKEAGAIHGSAWCVAQARGYLEDLHFDQYPETGKPSET